MASDLQKFRHGISVLKKQGLIPGRADSGVKIDGRSVIPSMKVKGKRLDTLVRKFDPVVSGKATALTVPKKELPKFRRAGFETTGDKILVPHTVAEKAKLVKGQVSIRSPKGVERVQIPVSFENLNQYLRDIKAQHNVINQLKGPREYFGIRFMGGQRANFYADIRDLINDLQKYQAVMQATRRYKQEEIYKHLEILRLNRRGAEAVETQIETRKREMSKEYNRRHAKRVREKIKRDPQRAAEYAAESAKRNREYRERVKTNARKAAHVRALNKKRQQKFRAKLKKKGKKSKRR